MNFFTVLMKHLFPSKYLFLYLFCYTLELYFCLLTVSLNDLYEMNLNK